jgi:hypothetical protein
MRRALALVALVAFVALMRGAQAADPIVPTPIVVELFTSEGCSSCPPADVLLQKLADAQPLAGVEIVPLSEHVDYWDRLGWKDRFSSAALTMRQQQYADRLNVASIYTPQVVVDGRAEIVGSDADAARRTIERARKSAHGTLRLTIQNSGAQVVAVAVDVSNLPPSRGDRADIVVAITEDGLRSNVTRGENHGRVLAHAAVVRSLGTIGEATADRPSTAHAEIPIGADWQRAQLKVVAFVQERRGRAILAAASARVQDAAR